MNLKIEAMPTEDAERVRRSLRDDYGNVLSPIVDDGGAPCRHCLGDAEPGERVLLFSYKPFRATHPYQEVGPVFIHANACARYGALDVMPADHAKRRLVLRPYDRHDRIADLQQIAQPGEAMRLARRMLENLDVAYVHVRSATRGCYLFRIERS